jgi:hypothetical protein
MTTCCWPFTTVFADSKYRPSPLLKKVVAAGYRSQIRRRLPLLARGSSLRQFTGINLTSLGYSAIRRDVAGYPARTLLRPVREHLYGAFMLVITNASRILTPDDAFGAIG